MKRVAIFAAGAAIGVGAAFGAAGCGDDETTTVTDVTGAVETAAEEKLETTSSSSSTTSTDTTSTDTTSTDTTSTDSGGVSP